MLELAHVFPGQIQRVVYLRVPLVTLAPAHAVGNCACAQCVVRQFAWRLRASWRELPAVHALGLQTDWELWSTWYVLFFLLQMTRHNIKQQCLSASCLEATMVS